MTDAARPPLSPADARRRIRLALRAAAVRYIAKLGPQGFEWLDAIGKVESGWNLGATNLTGPDGKRGGAYGPTQITARTARDHGFQGDPSILARDLDLAAEWTARILAAARPRSFCEAVAAWNAGRYGADRNRNGELDPGEAPARTIEEYWPRAEAALRYVRANPPDREVTT